MKQNLNRVASKMPFGYTDYIPVDETRNFKAPLPPADEVKSHQETTSVSDSESHSPETLANFEEYVKTNPLPSENYRQLPWSKRYSRASRVTSIYNTQKVGELQYRDIVDEGIPTFQDLNTKSTFDLSNLETKYRRKNGIPFQVDPIACHLFDEPIGIAHTQKLKRKFGFTKIMLNDPDFMEHMQRKLRQEQNRENEEAEREREENEIKRAIEERKTDGMHTDEHFKSMQLPQLCCAKPWLWQCEKDNEVTRDCLPEDVGISLPELPPKCDMESIRKLYVQIWSDNEKIHWNLSTSDIPSKIADSDSQINSEESDTKNELVDPILNEVKTSDEKIDAMDEAANMMKLYQSSKQIIENALKSTNQTIMS